MRIENRALEENYYLSHIYTEGKLTEETRRCYQREKILLGMLSWIKKKCVSKQNGHLLKATAVESASRLILGKRSLQATMLS